MRHANALSILKLLREAGSCSRADLVRSSGLSAPTVTNVVNDLLAENLIDTLGEGESSGGRPPDMIRFKAERGCILAVEISTSGISFLMTDLNGIELGMHWFLLAKEKTTPDAICDSINDGLRSLLRKKKMTREQLLMLVVGVPAITNVDQGMVMSISTFDGWRSVPLREMLREMVPCPVIVENDTNLAALGEQYCGVARVERDFILMSIGTNIGAGIILDGKIHHGSQWSAGEIAYLRLPHTTRRHLTLHEFGELETVLTSTGILASWREAVAGKTGPGMKGRKEGDLEEVMNLARSGDARAEKIIEQRAGMISDMIVNLSLILNPSMIVLAGEVGSHPVLLRCVQKQLDGSEFAVTKICASELGDRAGLWGAVSLALETIPSVLLPLPPD